MVTTPQEGQPNFTELSPGAIFFPHEIQDCMVSVHYQADSHLFKG